MFLVRYPLWEPRSLVWIARNKILTWRPQTVQTAMAASNRRASFPDPALPQAFQYDQESLPTISGDCDFWLPTIRRGFLGLTHGQHLQILAFADQADTYLPVPASARLGFRTFLEALRFIPEGTLFNFHCVTCRASTPFEHLFLELHNFGTRACVPFQAQRSRPRDPRGRPPLVNHTNWTESDREELRSRSRGQQPDTTTAPGNEENSARDGHLRRVQDTLPNGTVVTRQRPRAPSLSPPPQASPVHPRRRSLDPFRPCPLSKRKKFKVEPDSPPIIDLTAEEQDPKSPIRPFGDLTNVSPEDIRRMKNEAQYKQAYVHLPKVKQPVSTQPRSRPAARKRKRTRSTTPTSARPARPVRQAAALATLAVASQLEASQQELPRTDTSPLPSGSAARVHPGDTQEPPVSVPTGDEPALVIDLQGEPVTEEVDNLADTSDYLRQYDDWSLAGRRRKRELANPELRNIATTPTSWPSPTASGRASVGSQPGTSGTRRISTPPIEHSPLNELGSPEPYWHESWWRNSTNLHPNPLKVRIDNRAVGWIAPTITGTGPATSYKCNYPGCTVVCSDTTNWKTHYRGIHLKVYAFFCRLCGHEFTFRPKLVDHLASHHDLSPANTELWPRVSYTTCKRLTSDMDHPPPGMLPEPEQPRRANGQFAPKGPE